MNRITIFHYHLLPGGVTNVILLGVKALIRYYPAVNHIRLVCGLEQNTEKVKAELENEAPKLPEGSRLPLIEISILPEIYYADFREALPEERINTLAAKLISEYGDSFWWVHNYQLGKNPLFTAAVVRTAETVRAQKILLEIHDFPECARFDNLEKLINAGVPNPYPVSDNITYCCINGRDTRLLKSAGVPADRVFLLNNPVENDAPGGRSGDGKGVDLVSALFNHYKDYYPSMNPGAPLIFYPVRTIRRKNILEAGLIAAVSERPVNLLVSLPGVSEQERAYSETCRSCFAEGLIPGVWGSGADRAAGLPDYPQMLENCDMIISSSVQEGFGYLFINAVQLSLPLFSRDLDILDGIRGVFPEESCCFYGAFNVPVSRDQAGELRSAYLDKLAKVNKYLSAPATERLAGLIETLGNGGTADFSYLTVEMQTDVLRDVRESAEAAAEIRQLNSGLMNEFYRLLSLDATGHQLEEERFSLESHSDTVAKIIDFLYSDSAEKNPDKDRNGNDSIQRKLLDSFAELKYMRLLYDY